MLAISFFRLRLQLAMGGFDRQQAGSKVAQAVADELLCGPVARLAASFLQPNKARKGQIDQRRRIFSSRSIAITPGR